MKSLVVTTTINRRIRRYTRTCLIRNPVGDANTFGIFYSQGPYLYFAEIPRSIRGQRKRSWMRQNPRLTIPFRKLDRFHYSFLSFHAYQWKPNPLSRTASIKLRVQWRRFFADSNLVVPDNCFPLGHSLSRTTIKTIPVTVPGFMFLPQGKDNCSLSPSPKARPSPRYDSLPTTIFQGTTPPYGVFGLQLVLRCLLPSFSHRNQSIIPTKRNCLGGKRADCLREGSVNKVVQPGGMVTQTLPESSWQK